MPTGNDTITVAAIGDLHVTEGSAFKLPPETGRPFKLLDLSNNSATVQTPAGEKLVLRAE